MDNNTALIKIAERHGGVSCWFNDCVTITLTPSELRNIIIEALSQKEKDNARS